ncbi:MAG: histidine kinase [Actinobacteria bacterium]|nr:histidine kinase [Actinomycetota bacterium]MCL5888022.1 histidine kinase [Actinomycetota bacterium]
MQRVSKFKALMMSRRTLVTDMLLLFGVTVLAIVAAWGFIAIDQPRWMMALALGGLSAVALGSVVMRFILRPDHLRARQSHLILEIANQSLAHLRKGLTEQSAQAVCQITLEHTEAAAVAITDTERVLGFAGVGEDHHLVGGLILTEATHQALDTREHAVIPLREDIGCPDYNCALRAAIIVPLEMRGQACGTLKFYYTAPHLLNETQLAMAEGLARLLSTQLELSELERQTELAYRMELKALQAQINPHFLFNTINTIASLIRTDPPHARELLREFAHFYRRTLETSEEPVALQSELEYVRTYLHFERARFGERIVVAEDIDPRVLHFPVPAFIVQPVVENCIQHGMRAEAALHIQVVASIEDDVLTLSVIDDGIGISEDRLPHILEPGIGVGMGIALTNVHDRLKGHFGPGSGLKVESVEGVGTTVKLIIRGVDLETKGLQ